MFILLDGQVISTKRWEPMALSLVSWSPSKSFIFLDEAKYENIHLFFTYFSNSDIIKAWPFDRCQALICVRPCRVHDLSVGFML